MTQILRSVADRPRYYQYSTVKKLAVIPFKFITDASGVIQAGPGMPPQTFVTANTSTSFDLQVPLGNPAKKHGQAQHYIGSPRSSFFI